MSTTRVLLKKYGPSLAEPLLGAAELGFAEIAVRVLNAVIRPVLSYWHPALEVWEAARPEKMARLEHAATSGRAAELREALNALRPVVLAYARLLQETAGGANLVASSLSG